MPLGFRAGSGGFELPGRKGLSYDDLHGVRKHSEFVSFDCGSSEGNLLPSGLDSCWVGDGVVGAMTVDCRWWYP